MRQIILQMSHCHPSSSALLRTCEYGQGEIAPSKIGIAYMRAGGEEWSFYPPLTSLELGSEWQCNLNALWLCSSVILPKKVHFPSRCVVRFCVPFECHLPRVVLCHFAQKWIPAPSGCVVSCVVLPTRSSLPRGLHVPSCLPPDSL